jgi:hypothetical protein
MRLPLQQIQWIEPQCAIEQQLNIVEEDQIVDGMRGHKAAEETTGFDVAPRSGHPEQEFAKSCTNTENAGLPPRRQCVQQRRSSGSRRSNEEDQLAIE